MKFKSFYTDEEALQWAKDNGIKDYKLYPAEYFNGVDLGYEEYVKYEDGEIEIIDIIDRIDVDNIE